MLDNQQALYFVFFVFRVLCFVLLCFVFYIWCTSPGRKMGGWVGGLLCGKDLLFCCAGVSGGKRGPFFALLSSPPWLCQPGVTDRRA